MISVIVDMIAESLESYCSADGHVSIRRCVASALLQADQSVGKSNDRKLRRRESFEI